MRKDTESAEGVELRFGGQRLVLLPSRAVYAADTGTVYVADVHLGKGATFRASGIAVPEHAGTRDLQELGSLLRSTGATRLVVLGDLVHARSGMTDATVRAFERWRGSFAEVSVILVEGNHDRSAGTLPPSWGVEVVDAGADDGGLTLVHDPSEAPVGRPCLAGHIHPAVRLRERLSGASVRIPAFVRMGDVLTLPAFGAFTGMKVVRLGGSDEAFAVCDGAVVRVPG